MEPGDIRELELRSAGVTMVWVYTAGERSLWLWAV